MEIVKKHIGLRIALILFLLLVSGGAVTFYRTVYPYLYQESQSIPQLKGLLKQKTIRINNMNYSYWTNEVLNPKKIVVFLAPGPWTGRVFEPYVENAPAGTLIIAPDYPGRGLSTSIPEQDSIEKIAQTTALLLERLLDNRPFTIVGGSLGGAVGTEISKDKNLKIKSIVLIATGEFFAPDQKTALKILFYPASFSENLRERYRKILIERSEIYSQIDVNSLKDILEQLIAVIDYKIDTRQKHFIPTVIVKFKDDNIVQEDSLTTLSSVFPISKKYTLELPHSLSGFVDIRVQEIVFNSI